MKTTYTWRTRVGFGRRCQERRTVLRCVGAMLCLVMSSFLVAGCSPSHTETCGAQCQQCKELIGTVCNKALDCLIANNTISASKRQAEYDGCMSSNLEDVPCSKAVAVGSSYNTCLTDIKATACATFVTSSSGNVTLSLPSTCTGVIKIPQSSQFAADGAGLSAAVERIE